MWPDTVSHPVFFKALSRFGVTDFCFYTSHESTLQIQFLRYLCPMKFIILLALVVFTGCKSTSAKYDGTTGEWRVSDRRLFLRTEAEIVATIETNGTKSVSIKAKSSPEAEILKAGMEKAFELGQKVVIP